MSVLNNAKVRKNKLPWAVLGITIHEATPEQSEILNTKIDAFNVQQLKFTGKIEIEKSYIVRDASENILAGIKGCFYLEECLYISVLFVEELYRNKGLGRMLLQTLEQDALKMGGKLIHLDTFDFQAKDFYLKQGYEIFGVLEDCPKGHKRYYMKKVLR